MAALSTIARTQKQPQCPSADEWVKKLCIHAMEYSSAINRNKIESVLAMWMNLEPVIQSESEREKQISYINAFIQNLEKWY